MSDQKDRAFVREAVDKGLESMQGNPFLAQRILNQERTERPIMKKKISFAFILATILLLACAATAIAGAVNENFNTWLYRIWPEVATTLMPVNMSCEDNGIRMEVISAVTEGKDLYITFSMEDLEGDRLSTDNSPVMYVDTNPVSLWSASFEVPTKDEETGKILYGEHFVYDGKIGNTGVLLAHIPSFTSYREKANIDLFPYLEQYGGSVKTMTVPEEARILWQNDNYELPDYGEDAPGPIPADMQVLDTANSLEIPLADTVRLSGIGMVDGLLHVQLHYVNHQKTVMGKGLHRLVFRPDETEIALRDKDCEYGYDWTYHDPEKVINGIDVIGWGSQPDDPDTPEWVELFFTADADALTAEKQEFYAQVTERIPIQGSWTAEIPVRLIRKAE